jgi:hypothetical protein
MIQSFLLLKINNLWVLEDGLNLVLEFDSLRLIFIILAI